jgi:hypothetical protein
MGNLALILFCFIGIVANADMAIFIYLEANPYLKAIDK